MVLPTGSTKQGQHMVGARSKYRYHRDLTELPAPAPNVPDGKGDSSYSAGVTETIGPSFYYTTPQEATPRALVVRIDSDPWLARVQLGRRPLAASQARY